MVVDGKIIPIPAHGMKVISMGNFVDDNTPVVWRGPMLGKILRQFLNDVVWGEPDFLLLDLPPAPATWPSTWRSSCPRRRCWS